MTALEARSRLTQLQLERSLAQSTALAHVDAYMNDLEQEIVTMRQAYAGAAVMEIANLRAELFGRQFG
ncbi:MAG: hypothetical protein ACRDSN_22350 [Pseudonocardiaceae bacterium]